MMFKHKATSLIIAMTVLLNAQQGIANQASQQESFTSYITNKYLNSNFTTEEQPTISEDEKYGNNWLTNKDFEKAVDAKRQILNKRETQEAAFSIVTPSRNTTTTAIDASVVDKLELIGNGQNTNQHLLEILLGDKLHTSLSKAYAAFTFCNPITDITQLCNRQNAIELLSLQKQNLKKLNQIFVSIEPNEQKSLTHWHSKPVVHENLLNGFYFNLGPLKNLNTNTIALSAAYNIQNVIPLLLTGGILPAEIWIMLNIASREASKQYKRHVSRSEILSLMWQETKRILSMPEVPTKIKGLIIQDFR